MRNHRISWIISASISSALAVSSCYDLPENSGSGAGAGAETPDVRDETPRDTQGTTPPPTTPPNENPTPVPEPTPTPPPPTPPPPPPTPPPPTPPPPGVDAAALRAEFNTNVAPILQASCSQALCHAGPGTSPLKFLPAALADYYDYVTGYTQVVGTFDKASAPILTDIIGGTHFATYTPSQVLAIGAWLDSEHTARNSATPPPPPAAPTPGQVAHRIVSEWSGCMDLQVWNEENVATAWANEPSSEGNCIQCHINGLSNFLADNASLRVFDLMTLNEHFLTKLFVANVTDLANARVEINTTLFQNVANSVAPYTEHPTFDANGNAMQATQRFYDRTMERKAAGQCAPPRIP